MKKAMIWITAIIVIILVALLITKLPVKENPPLKCNDVSCSLTKLENSLSQSHTCNLSRAAYAPSYLYFKEPDIFLGISYFGGSVNSYAASPFYVNISNGKIGDIAGSEFENSFNNLHYWDYNYSCIYSTPYDCFNGKNFSALCKEAPFKYEKTEFNVPWPKQLNLSALGYTNVNNQFYKIYYEDSFEDKSGLAQKPSEMYASKDLIYYYRQVRISMGYSDRITTIILNGVYNVSAPEILINSSDKPLVQISTGVFGNYTVIQADDFYYKVGELPKYAEFFDYPFK